MLKTVPAVVIAVIVNVRAAIAIALVNATQTTPTERRVRLISRQGTSIPTFR